MPPSNDPWLHRARTRGHRLLTRDLWSQELGGLPTFRALGLKAARVLYIAVRGFLRDRCSFHAAALTYITVLSMVPVLAMAFSAAKGLGYYERFRGETIDPFLDHWFGPAAVEPAEGGAPAGAPATEELAPPPGQPAAGGAAPAQDAPEVALAQGDGPDAGRTASELRNAAEYVLDLVESADIRSLGLSGLALLVYTVIKLLGSVERSFNEIWGVRRSRSLLRKVADYLAIVMIAPIALVTGTAVTTTLHSGSVGELISERLHLGPVLDVLLRLLPMVVIWVGFTLIYLWLPNTRMRLRSALVGGVCGGALWQLAQYLHVQFQLWTARIDPIYSTFAAFPIFLIWMYVSWITVLLGAEFACAHHREPTFRRTAQAGPMPPSFREVVALRTLARIAAGFLRGDPPRSAEQVSEELRLPDVWVREVVDALVDAGLLSAVTDGDEDGLLPARALDRITVVEVQDALSGERSADAFPPHDGVEERIDRALGGLDEARSASAQNLTLRELGEESLRAAGDAAALLEPTPEPA